MKEANVTAARTETSEPNLGTLAEMNFSMAANRVLAAAVQLGVFSQIASGRAKASEIAAGIQASERGTQMLLDALTAFRLLSKKDGNYALSPVAAQHLVRESPDYMGFALEKDLLWDSWGHLTDAIRTGKPFRTGEARERAEEFFPTLVRTLHITNREPARQLARVLTADAARPPIHAVDVACGSGVWGIELAKADPRTSVTAQDFPKVLDLTRQYLKRNGVEERFQFLPGDLEEVDFGEAQFDLAILGNICHSEGEQASRSLFLRLHRALRQSGRLVIVDMQPNEDRSGPVYPLVFALNMLVNTEHGGTFTLNEYTRWLNAAGFLHVETADIGLHSPVIVGHKG
ncbi:MAG TPA: methyltransferase [Terriglobia bacterium]|nr:methyltransferase [Terriglobia bacterium]